MAGNREYKSDVFSMLMENPRNALELYNAVNHSHYTDPKMVEMCRLDRGISLTVRNDASFVVDMNLSVYEHQSTVCPNMPVRSLLYLANILERMLKDRNLYGHKLIRIPTPKFAVFYNGNEEQPECYKLNLSDAFERPVEKPEVELVCTVYNINYGKNKEILNRCHFLQDYMTFVDYVREYHKRNGFEELEFAIEQAIDRCIEENVLREFLREHRWEVVKVVTLDYTFERQLTLEREDSRMEGRSEGREEGRKEGREEGRREGREEGRKEGREEGRIKSVAQQIYKKLQRQKPLSQIAEELEESEDVVRPIYEAVVMKFPELDLEFVYNEIMKNQNTDNKEE